MLQSKRRGLSVEEKRTRLLELFFEKVVHLFLNTRLDVHGICLPSLVQKEFFQLKELEKMAQKEKGISKYLTDVL